MEERKFIEELYKEKAKNDSNSKSLTKLLNVLTKTVFGDANRFIFELLQNADDSPQNKIAADVEVEIKLFNHYLIFSHNGKHFTEDDVRGISDVGSGDSGKTKDLEKTGYKGIGFKSIFGTCNQVYILSNNFTFKFDKNYYVWQHCQDYPWQIIPIWLDKSEIEEQVLNEIAINNVNTVIFIENRNKIKDEISNIFNDARLILFLRNIKKITFYDERSKVFQVERKNVGSDLREIYINQILKSSWLYKEFLVPVDQDLREKIKNLDSAICPEKLKQSLNTKISFAALVSNEELQILSNDIIYCYLPTKVKYDFNYLINGDFITNAERSQILENDWNSFIFNQIALCNIQWAAELAKTNDYKYQFVRLIKSKFNPQNSSMSNKSFNAGLDKALEKTPFIPMQGSNEYLLKINECILDTTGFSSIFGTEILEKYYDNKYKVADCKIKYQSQLVNLGAEKFDISNLCELFLTDLFKEKFCLDLELELMLIEFLYKQNINFPTINWLKYLETAKFLLDNKNQLNSPANLYFPIIEGDTENASIIDYEAVNCKLYEKFKDKIEIHNWLVSLGVKHPSDIDIFRKSIAKMIESNGISSDNAMKIGRFVFKIFENGDFNDNDYKILRKLKIITNKGSIEIPTSCYLPDFYEPILKIEHKFVDGTYVSQEYVQKKSDIEKWKKMFIRIGVKEKINIVVEEYIERLKLREKYPLVQTYLEFIDDDGSFYDNITRPYISQRQHGFNYFVFIDYLNYCDDYNFSLSFWKTVITDNWAMIHTNCLKSTYYTKLATKPVVPFFQYYIKNCACLPANDGKCYKSTVLYSKSLKKIIGDNYPVINDNIIFNKEQEDFLGIKSILTVYDCINLLNSINKHKVNGEVLIQISTIYRHLIKSQSDDKLIIEKDTIKFLMLLATDDTFQLINELYCFEVNGLLPPISKNFIKISEQIKDRDTLCTILSIPVIRDSDLGFKYVNAVIEQNLLNIIKTKEKYFATIIANIKAEEPQIILKKISAKLSNVKFYTAQSLCLFFSNKEGQEIYNQDIESWFCVDTNSIYYTGSWKSPLTLYSLSNSLCSFFELEGKDREVSLLLQLSDVETERWLISKGYEIVEFSSGTEEDIENYDLVYDNLYENEVEVKSSIGIPENEEYDDECNDTLNLTENGKFADVSGSYSSNIQNKSTRFSSVDEESDNCTDNESHSIKGQNSNSLKNSNANRLISYVANELSEDCKQNVDKSKLDIQRQCRAIKVVCGYEEQSGRNTIEVSELEVDQYIISQNKQSKEIERYIKVFGFFGEWNNFDVAMLSASQMKFAKEKGNQFWIYVVEFVEDEKNMHLYRIQNPFDKVSKYAFDHGWRGIAEKDNLIDGFSIGTKIRHNIHGIGTIVDEIKKGKSILLIVKFANGDKKIPLNLTQMEIMEE